MLAMLFLELCRTLSEQHHTLLFCIALLALTMLPSFAIPQSRHCWAEIYALLTRRCSCWCCESSLLLGKAAGGCRTAEAANR